MSKAVCLQDIEDAAHKVLPKNALDYYKSGAEQQSTLHDNRRAFQRQALGVVTLMRYLDEVSRDEGRGEPSDQ